ncbi:MAG: Gfo/Idh/MocA family oxidoreductase [Firmicutes bacterium]|nr:Gfo/Idh/MocA family oxidoreductase [Bacillota bacterium]
MEEIRLGTVGTGSIVHHILDAVSAAEGIRCTAVYSHSREKAEALAAEYNIPGIYTNHETMLSDPAVNCVYIASPNSLHFPQMMQALRHGKHVICEKPLCPTVREVREAAALAEANHLMLAEAVPTMHLANYRCLEEALTEIGAVRTVSCRYGKYSSRYDALKGGSIPNVFSLKYAGGCLADINYYNLYLCAALFGQPEKLNYKAEIWPGAADTSGTAVLQYPGITAYCCGAKDKDLASYVWIEGERGRIFIPGGANGIRELWVYTEKGREIMNPDKNLISPEIRQYLSARTGREANPFRWYLEICSLTKLFLMEDHAALRRLLAVSETTAAMTELARESAGIHFV